MSVPTAKRLTFREMQIDDLDLIHSLLGDPEVMAFYPRPKTRAECAEWISRARSSYAEHGHGLWILENESGSFIGECGLLVQDVDGPKIEIGYHLLPSAQGQGYASEAARVCVQFAQAQGHLGVISIIDPGNIASKRVAEAAGLTRWKTHSIFGGPKHIYRLDFSAMSSSIDT